MREKEGYCGPDVLQQIASRKGKDITQCKLAELMQTTERDGTSHTGMMVGAVETGLKPHPTKDLKIEQLAELADCYYKIVNWIQGEDEREDGHYSILKGIEDGKVILEDGEVELGEFDRRWYDFDKGSRVEKWAMLIHK